MKESELIQRKRKRLNILLWGAIIVSVICMVGFLVTLVMLGLNAADIAILSYLCGGFLVLALLFGLLGLAVFRLVDKIAVRELDALEREDDEHSFHVGEGTLATLDDGALRIHGGKEGRTVRVPYFDMKFYSVCNRKRPREKGSWCVLVEIPAHYINKREEAGMQPVLIQMDGKERLYARLKELGLELLGEEPKLMQGDEKFTLMQKFVKPDEGRRKKTIVLMIIGLLLIVGGFFIFFFLSGKYNQATSIGSVVVVLGVYFGVRAIYAYINAKAVFSVYREGIFFHSSNIETVFLKWEEINGFEEIVREDASVLRAKCLYGNYDFPLFEDAYKYIAESFPEKAPQGSGV